MAGKWWLRATFAVLVALGLAAGAWHLVTTRMEAELATWREARLAEGWRIRHAPPVRMGFPLHATLRLGEVVLETPARLGWQADVVTLRLDLTEWGVVRTHLAGAQALRHASGVTPVQAEALELRTRLADGITELAAARLALPGLEAREVAGRLAGQGVRLLAGRIEVPGLPPLEAAALEARVNPPPTASAAEWQAAGGQLHVDRMEFRSGRVVTLFTGTLNLDRALQPEGRGTLSVTHPAEAVGALSEAGLVSADLVRPLRAMVLLAARIPPEGGAPRLDLPVEIRNRRVMAARMPLATLPALDWR